MVDKTIGIGIIGLGMGSNVLAINRVSTSKLEVRGICDAVESKTRSTAEQWSLPFWTTDYHKLIAREDIQVIAVYSPDHLHAEHAIAAMKAGKHIICTKPMCTSVKDAAEMVRLSDQKHLKFLVGQTMRFDAEFANAKRMFDDGDLGEIILAEAHYVHDSRTFMYNTPWRITAPQNLMFGGASHPIDLLRWFLGDVEEVHAYARRGGLLPEYPIEDNFLINLKFKNGAVGRVLTACGVVEPPVPMMQLVLYCTKASLVAQFGDQAVGYSRVVFDKLARKPTATFTYPAEMEGNLGHGPAVIRYLKHFEECLDNDLEPSPGVRDGARSIAVGCAAWDSIHKGGVFKPQVDF